MNSEPPSTWMPFDFEGEIAGELTEEVSGASCGGATEGFGGGEAGHWIIRGEVLDGGVWAHIDRQDVDLDGGAVLAISLCARTAASRFLRRESGRSSFGQVRSFWCVVLPSPGGAALAGIQVGYSPARPLIRLKLFRRRQRSQAWNTAADAAAPHAGPTARSLDADHARSPSRFLLHEAAAIGGRRLSCDPAEDARKSARGAKSDIDGDPGYRCILVCQEQLGAFDATFGVIVVRRHAE